MDETNPGTEAGHTSGSESGPPPGADTGSQAGPQAGPHATAAPGVDWQQVRGVHRLQRPTDRMVAGVCAGLGRHFDVDPLVLRVAFGVLTFFGGAGLLLYGALWLLLPEEGHDRAPVHLDERTRGVALAGVAVLAALALVGDSWGLYGFPWPLVLLALVAWVLYDRSRDTARAAPAPPQPYGPPTGAPEAYDHGAYTQPTSTQPPYTQPAYTQPAYTQPAYAQPTYTQPLPTRPRDPRRRGPVLFGFTLALVALAMGALGTADLAGVSVVDSAYPATATAICAAMLLVGAFWGRAGGITALALVAALVTAGVFAAEQWDDGARLLEATPSSAGEVRDVYELNRGDLTVDLSDVEDLDALDGRDLRLELGVGRIRLVLPDDLGVDLDATVGGPGSIRLPDGPERGGIAVSTDTSFGPADAPRVQVRAELGVGEIEVVQR